MDNFKWFKASPLIDENIFKRNILGIFDEPISICKKNDKNKKGNDNMEEILEIYSKYQIKKIDEEVDKEIDKTIQESKLGKIANKFKKEIDKELEKIFENYNKEEKIISLKVEADDQTNKKIDEIIEKGEKRKKELKNKINEAKALLNITETYEQKTKILYSYNIIDENGKIKK